MGTRRPAASRLPFPGWSADPADAVAVVSRAVLAVLECPDIETAAAHVLEASRRVTGATRGRMAVLGARGGGRWVGGFGPGRTDGRARAVRGDVRGLAALLELVGGGRIEERRRGDGARLPLPRPCGGWEGVLAVPLASGGRSEGLLLLGDRPGGFSRRDLLVAASLGALAGAAHQRCVAAAGLARSLRESRAALAAASRDLRRQVRAGERVRRSLEREHAIRLAVENGVMTGLSASDRDGRIVHVNRAFCRIVGWRPAELVGCGLPHPYWPPERRTEYLKRFRALGTGPIPPQGYRVEFQRRGGERFDAWVKVAPLKVAEGGWVASLTDLTQEVRAEAELRRALEQLRIVSAQLIEAGERERKRISRELHDSLGQTLTALRLRLEGTLSQCGRPNCRLAAQSGLREALDLLAGAAAEVRAAVAALRPSILDDLGLDAALSWLCRETGRLNPSIGCGASVRLAGARPPEVVATTVFRIVQEALTNAVKHSGARRVRVRLAVRRGRLELSVEDDGRGVPAGRAARGFGLSGMRERAELAGGTFALAPRRGGGTAVRASWPLPPAGG